MNRGQTVDCCKDEVWSASAICIEEGVCVGVGDVIFVAISS